MDFFYLVLIVFVVAWTFINFKSHSGVVSKKVLYYSGVLEFVNKRGVVL